jgi:hypothetical protein
MPQKIVLIHKGFFLICKPNVLYLVSHNLLVVAYRYPPLVIHFETQSLHLSDVIPNIFLLQLPLKLSLMLFLPQVNCFFGNLCHPLENILWLQEVFLMVYATNSFNLTLNTHLHQTKNLPLGNLVSTHVLFFFKDEYSSHIASFHLFASSLIKVSFRITSSFPSHLK